MKKNPYDNGLNIDKIFEIGNKTNRSEIIIYKRRRLQIINDIHYSTVQEISY